MFSQLFKILIQFILEDSESIVFILEAFLNRRLVAPHMAHYSALAVAILAVVGATGVEVARPRRILSRFPGRLIYGFAFEWFHIDSLKFKFKLHYWFFVARVGREEIIAEFCLDRLPLFFRYIVSVGFRIGL